jgi:hypothetical protein
LNAKFQKSCRERLGVNGYGNSQFQNALFT